MQKLRRFFPMIVMVSALCTLPVYTVEATPRWAHDSRFGELRGIVDRTQTDLRRATELAHGNKQNDRYHKAQDHLSKLDKSLSHGKYNKGALNDSIDGIKSILDHNTLQASSRDELMRDLTDLKIARDRN